MMKCVFRRAIPSVSAAPLAFLLACLSPVQATTFPSPALIYAVPGVLDVDGSTSLGTSITCLNLSSQNATVRWRFLSATGASLGLRTEIIQSGRTVAVGTANGTNIHSETLISGADNFQGSVAIYSTQSAVFCNAVVASSAAPEAGHALNTVRFNTHPGTTE
jgi:hypothetical protein